MRHILLCTQYDLDECTPIGLVAYFIGWGYGDRFAPSPFEHPLKA